jgi:hypothetical protein
MNQNYESLRIRISVFAKFIISAKYLNEIKGNIYYMTRDARRVGISDPNKLHTCKICNRTLPLYLFFIAGNNYYGKWCKQCQSDKQTARYHSNHPDAKNYKNNLCCNPYWNARFAAIYNRAKRRGLECTITVQDLIDCYIRQNGLCYYTGELMIIDSVDRLDNTKGYIPENIVMCERKVNSSKSTKRKEDFITMCIKVAEQHGITQHGIAAPLSTPQTTTQKTLKPSYKFRRSTQRACPLITPESQT